VKRALIVGCGYAGIQLGVRLLKIGCEVVGTTRHEARAVGLEAAGIEPLAGELDERQTLERIASYTPDFVVYLVPPQSGGDLLLPKILTATTGAALQAFVYAGSTSVYGDRDGDWVDETTAAKPEGDVARARAAAERLAVDAAATGIPTRICRITGIYGPGRTLKGLLASGDYVLIKGRDAWVNRIHVDDLVTGIIAAGRHGSDGRIYNMVDDEPHRASEFANLAADLHRLPRPQWIDEPEARARYDAERLRRKLENKRVRSLRLAEELGVELEYRSYVKGLPASIGSKQ
jgi:nucleoside-diphosphate-sugar epimerase